MSHKSYSWARVDVRLPNARVVTFRDFEIKAPKSTCRMLTHRGITSIEALCQAAHLFECLYFYNHTLYRLAAFKQMVNLFSAIVFGSFFFFLSIEDASGLQSLHHQQFILSEATSIQRQCSSPSIEFLFDVYFHGFFFIDECTFPTIFACVFHESLAKFVLVSMWL